MFDINIDKFSGTGGSERKQPCRFQFSMHRQLKGKRVSLPDVSIYIPILLPLSGRNVYVLSRCDILTLGKTEYDFAISPFVVRSHVGYHFY